MYTRQAVFPFSTHCFLQALFGGETGEIMKSIQAKFLGLDITVINHEDKPYVPMKQIAENIGLVWHAQFERLQRNEILSQGVRIIRMPSNGCCRSRILRNVTAKCEKFKTLQVSHF